jgi:hypothetical protein
LLGARPLAFEVDASDLHGCGRQRGDEQAMHGGDVVVPPRLRAGRDRERRGRDDGDETGEFAPVVEIERGDGAGESRVDADEPNHAGCSLDAY